VASPRGIPRNHDIMLIVTFLPVSMGRGQLLRLFTRSDRESKHRVQGLTMVTTDTIGLWKVVFSR
jgi:hypothetical protein